MDELEPPGHAERVETISNLARAVEAGRPRDTAELFTVDARYHDVAYGAFNGRKAITGFICSWFDGAEDFTWRFFDIVSGAGCTYARYYISYSLTSKRLSGRKVESLATAQIRFTGKQIADYDEALNLATPLLDMGVPERMVVAKLRQRAALDHADIAAAKNDLDFSHVHSQTFFHEPGPRPRLYSF